MSTKTCAVMYYPDMGLIYDVEIWIHFEECSNVPSVWIDVIRDKLTAKTIEIRLYSTEVDYNLDNLTIEIPNLFLMNEEEYFQYSLLNPFIELGVHKFDIGLIKSIIDFTETEHLKPNKPVNSKQRSITFEY